MLQHRWIFCFTLICFFSFFSFSKADSSSQLPLLLQKAHQMDLGDDPQWWKLLHYERTLLGFRKSQANSDFFLAADGSTNPQAELDATLKAFFSTEAVPAGQQHPQCRFRGRFLYLKRKLGFEPDQLPSADCSRFEHFAQQLSARSITVVFSSYYLNNPSSAFGHSFIRVNKTDHPEAGKQFELLDYGINYAADVNVNNPIIYAVKGLTGMFHGSFTSVPYYYKVREYSDFEKRDLWEYDLNLTPDQIELLIAHFWELGSTRFDYYYLTENCSYHVLSVLDAVNPNFKLLERQPKVVIPSDTMKVLVDTPGLVKEIHYRPSVRTQFDYRLKLLSPPQRDLLKVSIEARDPGGLPSDLSSQDKAKILDAEADFIDLNYNKELIKREGDASQWMQKVLVARSKLRVVSSDLEVPTPSNEMPHVGHGSARVGVEPGYNSSLGAFTELSYRFALHDLLDPLPGYPSYAQIEMMNLQFRTNLSPNQQSFWLDQLELFRVTSLNPITSFDRKLSWRVNFGITRFYDGTCNYCIGPSFEVGGGWTIQPIQSVPLMAFLLGETEASASPAFDGSHFRIGLGPAAGLRIAFSDRLLSLVEGGYRYEVGMLNPHVYRAEAGMRWNFTKQWAFNLRGAIYPQSSQASLGLLFYH